MTDRYAVFGNPIKHSLSPQIHQAFAQQTKQDLSYSKELIAEDAFEAAVTRFFSEGGGGLNITVPFKQRAFDMIDVLSERAEFAGAVNTLFMCDGKLHGDNTDGVGLLTDMQQAQQWTLKGQRILLLGAGGAARGTLLPLLQAEPSEIVIANRTLSKAQALEKRFSPKAQKAQLSVAEFKQLSELGAFDFIINSTSASLSGDGLKLPSSLCFETTACYDMAYAKEPTVFLQWAATQGVTKMADGLGMLLEQAAEAFYVWREVRPSTDGLRQSLR